MSVTDCQCENRHEDESCRIFEIGIGRTGSRSLTAAVRKLGISAKHGVRGCPHCSQDVVEKHLQGRIDFDQYKHTMFHANIANIHWQRLLHSDDTSKFILTTRPLDSWLDSWATRARKIGGSSRYYRMTRDRPISFGPLSFLHFFGQLEYDRQVWMDAYNRHVENVMRTIPIHRLLIVDIFLENSVSIWHRLIEFLSECIPPEHRQGMASLTDEPFPHVGHRQYV